MTRNIGPNLPLISKVKFVENTITTEIDNIISVAIIIADQVHIHFIEDTIVGIAEGGTVRSFVFVADSIITTRLEEGRIVRLVEYIATALVQVCIAWVVNNEQEVDTF